MIRIHPFFHGSAGGASPALREPVGKKPRSPHGLRKAVYFVVFRLNIPDIFPQNASFPGFSRLADARSAFPDRLLGVFAKARHKALAAIAIDAGEHRLHFNPMGQARLHERVSWAKTDGRWNRAVLNHALLEPIMESGAAGGSFRRWTRAGSDHQTNGRERMDEEVDLSQSSLL